MDDTISRQAAIEALCESCSLERDYHKCDGYKKNSTWCDEVTVLRGVPSAQSEIIRCKDCKHFEYNHPYIIQGIPVLGHEVCNAWGDGCKTDENGYCFMAERRTDEAN